MYHRQILLRLGRAYFQYIDPDTKKPQLPFLYTLRETPPEHTPPISPNEKHTMKKNKNQAYTDTKRARLGTHVHSALRLQSQHFRHAGVQQV
jgi:hypothetical protein